MEIDNQIDNRPIHLYFDRHFSEILCNEEFSEILNTLPRKIIFCHSWTQLADLLKHKPLSVAFNENELLYGSAVEIVNMVNTLSKLSNIDYVIPITVVITKQFTSHKIKEIQKSGVYGILPFHKSFPIEETIKGLHAQFNNIPYWPKHIIEQLPGNKTKTKVISGKVILTPRQKQIYELLIERGSSNKIIAKTLTISESTVKLHMGHILRKFGAKNRTQLVAFRKNKDYEEV